VASKATVPAVPAAVALAGAETKAGAAPVAVRAAAALAAVNRDLPVAVASEMVFELGASLAAISSRIFLVTVPFCKDINISF
jgi:hypothetical protein